MQRGAYIEPDKITLAQFLERWLAHIKTQVEPGTYDLFNFAATISSRH
jgi:hypothetical protein